MRFFILFISLFCLASTAHALIGLNLKTIPPLTKLDLPPQAEFEKQTKLIQYTPHNDKFLSYEMRLPESWIFNKDITNKSIDRSLSDRVLGTVARYTSPARQYLRSFFSVDVMELPNEIGARNWFINYVLSNGMSLEQVGTEHHNEVEALYIEVQGDITYVVRVKAIKNGPRMIFARHYLPQELYNEGYIEQAQIINSFHLINYEDTGVEPLRLHGFLDQTYFNYPESWQLKASNVKSINRMNALLFHSSTNNKLDGQMNIYLTNKSLGETRSEALNYYQDKFKIEGYTLDQYIGDVPVQYHSDMKFGLTQMYTLKPRNIDMIDYELWVSFSESDGYYYIITLMTPARNADFYTWARNEAAFKIVLNNIRQYDDNVDLYQFIQ